MTDSPNFVNKINRYKNDAETGTKGEIPGVLLKANWQRRHRVVVVCRFSPLDSFDQAARVVPLFHWTIHSLHLPASNLAAREVQV